MSSAITIFGGSGDLSFRKLLPAFYNLDNLNKLEDDFKIFVVGRKEWNNDILYELILPKIKYFSRFNYKEKEFKKFINKVEYVKIDLDDKKNYIKLIEKYNAFNINDHIFYYAVSPEYFEIISNNLPKEVFKENIKLIVEKPFGTDMKNAQYLHNILINKFKKDNIYYIDSYLGKEMIQNILSIRFKNIIFKGIWNKDYIESIHINVFEEIGIGKRGNYFDKHGTIKDMIQNHLLQMLTYTLMDEPDEFNTKNIHKNQLKVLRSINKNLDYTKDMVLGQYEGYLDELNIPKGSLTETFASIRIFLNDKKFENIPIYLNSGKKFEKRESEIIIKFKSVNQKEPSNLLIIKVQPDEGIHFQLNVKKVGEKNITVPATLDFFQSCILENKLNTPESYEVLLYDAIQNNKNLFSTWEFIKESWEFIENVRDEYFKNGNRLIKYKIGNKDLTLK